MLDSAKDLNDLRVPPGNRLKKLSGDRRGQNSIRIMTNGKSAFDGEMTALGTSKFVDHHRGTSMTRNRMRADPPGRNLAPREFDLVARVVSRPVVVARSTY
jgi:hypothetical protein